MGTFKGLVEARRALPFQGLAIKFGQACVTTDQFTTTLSLSNEGNWFVIDKLQLPKDTIITPIVCLKIGNYMVTKCLAGGYGIVFLSVRTKVDRVA